MIFKGTQRSTTRLLSMVAITWSLVSIGQSALAQHTVTSATLGGRIEDVRGAGIAGGTVTAINLATNQTQTATT
ncbi:MAG: hypothetical protein ACREA9_26115, partial [Pyrinomonadaceae bacterium]